MPTQEERLAALEQDLARFKTDTFAKYQDFAIQFTVTKTLAENTIGQLAIMQDSQEHSASQIRQYGTWKRSADNPLPLSPTVCSYFARSRSI